MDADKYFDHWAGHKVWRNLKNPKHQRRFDILARHLEGETFADVGCGFGHSTAELKARKPGAWTGIDFTARGIEQAREHFPDLPFLFMLDFKAAGQAGPFDFVVCSEILEHVEDDQAAADALLKMTKRLLVISTPNKRVIDPGHLRIYTDKTLDRLFSNARANLIFEDGPFFYVEVLP